MTGARRRPPKVPPKAPVAPGQQGPVPAASEVARAPSAKSARKRRPRFVL